MKTKLISDLHLEHGTDIGLFLNYDTDIIIIAGDLHSGAVNVASSLAVFADIYDHVIYVPGNHEYYGSSIEDFDTTLRDLISGYKNIHYLNNASVTLEGVTYIGTPLWTNFRNHHLAMHAAKSMISDFKMINGFGIKKCTDLYFDAVEYLKWAYENTHGPKVVITHFLPAVECIDPKYAGEGLLNMYFANNLGGWIRNLNNVTWMHGHTHSSVDIKLGDTRILANPHGYPLSFGAIENKGFKVSVRVETKLVVS